MNFIKSHEQNPQRNFIARSFLTFFLFVSSAFGQSEELDELVKQTEANLEARIGITVHFLDSGSKWEYNGDDRFPMSSTFKTVACAALLHRVDRGLDSLSRAVIFEKDELVSYSPATESNVGGSGLTLAELCEATITLSDNTAGNLILSAIGGPVGFTEFTRSLGDNVTQLNRWETSLNESIPGDARDTTSPNAMATLLEKLLFEDVLSQESRNTLKSWLTANAVGDDLLRAGIPDDWEIGDKTGAGGYGSRSIAAVMWPPAGGPIISTIYITETSASFADRNAAIAFIGGAIVNLTNEQQSQ